MCLDILVVPEGTQVTQRGQAERGCGEDCHTRDGGGGVHPVGERLPRGRDDLDGDLVRHRQGSGDAVGQTIG